MEITKSCENITLSAKVLDVGEDLLIILTGGRAHIGAVSLANSKNEAKTVSLDTHKEDIITQKVASHLREKTDKNICVVAGIHFDDISKKQIEIVLDLVDEISHEIDKYF